MSKTSLKAHLIGEQYGAPRPFKNCKAIYYTSSLNGYPSFNLYVDEILYSSIVVSTLTRCYVFEYPNQSSRQAVSKFARYFNADEIIYLCEHPKQISSISRTEGVTTITPQILHVLQITDYTSLIQI